VGKVKHFVPMLTQLGSMGLRQLSTLPIGQSIAGNMTDDYHMDHSISNTDVKTSLTGLISG
jgi:hypothetical protein